MQCDSMCVGLDRIRFLTRNLEMKSLVIKGWMLQILSGLHYLHTQTVDDDGTESPFVHMDLKCEHIFMQANTAILKIGALELGTFIQNSSPSSFDGMVVRVRVVVIAPCISLTVDRHQAHRVTCHPRCGSSRRTTLRPTCMRTACAPWRC
jgi:serine/threonine protein kinase